MALVGAPNAEPIFIYYKLFDEDLEEPCKVRKPIYANNPYIGLVDATVIPPPHTVSALVGRICKKEDKGIGFDWDHDLAFSTVLFKTIDSPEPYSLKDSISLLGEDRPGSNPQNPVILKVACRDLPEVLGVQPREDLLSDDNLQKILQRLRWWH